ncbi:hypothetical protein RFI_14358, partial [Reticulomyxa filosa]
MSASVFSTNPLLKDPKQGAKDFFASNPSKEQIWKLLEFLLWSHQEPKHFPRYFEWLEELASGGHGFEETFLKVQIQGACGRPTRDNEITFMCKTCANLFYFQCSDCFKQSDHVGHDVRLNYISSFCGCELDPNVEMACRFVCGYMVYLLSHAFSSDHHD